MKILVTGSKGFVGKNLIVELKNRGYKEIFEFDKDTDKKLLNKYTKACEFVFHLAGVNRPKSEKEFMVNNFGFTSELLDLLKKNNNRAPILITSSIQARLNNPYGRSKKEAEDLLFSYSKETGAKVFIYRLPNIFGKWCRPNYNSVVATFCYNIANNLEIKIDDPEAEVVLCYIDDVIDEFLKVLENKKDTNTKKLLNVSKNYRITVGKLAKKIYSFKKNRVTLIMPELSNSFGRALFGTFSSYLPKDDFSYKLKKNKDERGWLAEFIKSESMGQIFISKTKPGITRGNHWHHTKVEKFLVIKGEAIIRFRQINTNEIIDYKVNGEEPEVVDIPPGYTHSITNIGKDDAIVLFWASEIFDKEKPDTYYLEV
jgi:UDP-2-acetamido-2,6-beta-L-arabino-hexul-4-ose reductase